MASYIGSKSRSTAALMLLLVITMMGHIFVEVEARNLLAGSYGEEAMKERHHKWMAKHGRAYSGEAEKGHRFQVFKANAAFVDRSNAAAGKKYHLAINEFADMTSDEFMAMYTGFKPVPTGVKKMPGFIYGNVTLSSDDQQTVDWRQKGAVTGVKNQGHCGNNLISYMRMYVCVLFISFAPNSYCKIRRLLLGFLCGRCLGGHPSDLYRQPGLAVRATGAGLLHGREQRLQRRFHGQRLPVHHRQWRPYHRGRLPLQRCTGHVPVRPADGHDQRLPGRAQRR
jgi:hypothetical protein